MKNVFKKAAVLLGAFFTGFLLWVFRKSRELLLHERNRTSGIGFYNKDAGERINDAIERTESAERRSKNLMDGLTADAERLTDNEKRLERAGEIIESVKKRGKKKNY